MKMKLFLLAVGVLLTAIVLMQASGADASETNGTCGDDLTWDYDQSTHALVISGTGPMNDYELGTAPWFEYREEMTSLTLDNGITYIGAHAFDGCTGFVGSLVIPDSVTSIGDSSFNNCFNFNGTLTLSNNLESIGYSAFDFCSRFVGTLTIPDSVTSIGRFAFYQCLSLDGLKIGSGLTAINTSSFCRCAGIESLVIPDNITSIANGAFQECTSISSIVISDSVTSIGNYSFAYCKALTDVDLGDGMKTIGVEAFLDCCKMTSITLPKSLESIGDCAFDMCYVLVEVCNDSDLDIVVGSEDHGSVAYLAKNVYSSDSGASILEIVADGQYVAMKYDNEYYLLPYGEYVAEAKLPSSFRYGNAVVQSYSLGDFFFYENFSIISVVIPDSVTSIGDYAFQNCTYLKNVEFGKVKTIGRTSFTGCGELEKLMLPDTLTSIGDYAFMWSDATYISMPASLETMGERTFAGITFYAVDGKTVLSEIKDLAGHDFEGSDYVMVMIDDTQDNSTQLYVCAIIIGVTFLFAVLEIVRRP